MSFIKMTNILVKTSDFFATLTYSDSKTYDQWDSKKAEAPIIEVSPIISAKNKNSSAAEVFFHIITSDASNYNSQFKEGLFDKFAIECGKRNFEEFWDSADWSSVETHSLTIPSITCILYNKQGEAIHIRECSPIQIVRALKKIEQTLFSCALPGKTRATLPTLNSHRKELRKDLNRETHKYFLHHRGQR